MADFILHYMHHHFTQVDQHPFGLFIAINAEWHDAGMAGFAQVHQSAMADGALPTKVKEMMALVVGVVKHCDGCVAYHARGAAAAGATEDEVVEALGVALLMEGGPASVWAPRALEAFREFAEPA